jgi:hypothetical protein
MSRDSPETTRYLGKQAFNQVRADKRKKEEQAEELGLGIYLVGEVLYQEACRQARDRYR